MNVVAIVPVEYMVDLVVVFPIVWAITHWSHWDQPPLSTLTATGVSVLGILNLVVAATVLVIATTSRGVAEEAHRVLLWGVVGLVLWFVVALILQTVLSWAAMSSTRGVSEYYAFGLIPVIGGLVDGFPHSVLILSWMRFAVAVLAGLGCPGRLMVPRWLSGDARTPSDANILAALTVYSVCAVVIFWILSSVAMVLAAVVLH